MNPGKKYWLDDPRHVNWTVYALYAICVLLIALDLFDYKHGHFGFENWWGFFGWFGFLACVCLVLAAKQFRNLVRREEDYYDR